MINHKLISFSAVQIYDLTFLYSVAKIVVVVSFSYKEAQFKKIWSPVKNSCPHDKNIKLNEAPVSRSASSRFDLPLGIYNYFYVGRGDIPPQH